MIPLGHRARPCPAARREGGMSPESALFQERGLLRWLSEILPRRPPRDPVVGWWLTSDASASTIQVPPFNGAALSAFFDWTFVANPPGTPPTQTTPSPSNSGSVGGGGATFTTIPPTTASIPSQSFTGNNNGWLAGPGGGRLRSPWTTGWKIHPYPSRSFGSRSPTRSGGPDQSPGRDERHRLCPQRCCRRGL